MTNTFDDFLHKLEQHAKVIDNGEYPLEYIQNIATFGGYDFIDNGDQVDFTQVIKKQTQVAKICLNTAFCMWCQSAFLWYIYNSENTPLRDRYLTKVQNAQILAGTGLSNPMKALANIEPILLEAKPTKGGYILNGKLPTVSNVQKGHLFGVVAKENDGQKEQLIFGVVDTSLEALSIRLSENFLALNGSATIKASFKDYFLPTDMIISENAKEFLEEIRPGFMVLQAAMGFGNILANLQTLKESMKRKKYLEKLAVKEYEAFEIRLTELQNQAAFYAKNPYTQTKQQHDEVVKLRLEISNLSLETAQNAMLKSGGSQGYYARSKAFRKLRESYFVGMVTPSVEQLKHMLYQENAS